MSVRQKAAILLAFSALFAAVIPQLASCGENHATLRDALRILAVGDSICRGSRNAGKGFVGDLGLPYKNLGENGATLSEKRENVINIPDQLDGAGDFEPDIIIADGGVNDYLRDVPLGTLPDSPVSDPAELGEEATETVMGGLQRLFVLMKSRFPQAKRYFVITHKTMQRYPMGTDSHDFTDSDIFTDWTVTPNRQGYTQQDLHDALAECCRVYGVEVIDVYSDSPLNTADAQYCSDVSFYDDPTATEREYMDIDGVHPFDLGYAEFYLPLVREHIMKNQ